VLYKSRIAVAPGLVIALAASAIAFATGATDNQAFVDGKVKTTKLPKNDYVKNQLFTGVRTETSAPLGTQSNPASETINFGTDIKFNMKAGKVCSAPLPNGATPEQARSACPKDSYLGSGQAELIQPNGARISDVVVTAFHGQSKNGILLQTYSPTLGTAAPTVPGAVQKSKAGGKYGQALVVANAPQTGTLMITKFNATIQKSTGLVLTRCKSKTIPYLRNVKYADGTSGTATTTQKCTRKG
jgi:hypothetical protein